MTFTHNYLNKIFQVLAYLLLVFSCVANADENLIVKVEHALKQLDAIDNEQWSYVHTRESLDEMTVSEFDPRRPKSQQWKLLLLNGNVPSVEQFKAFDQIWNDEELTESRAKISSMIFADSLVYRRSSNGIAIFNFTPVVEDMQEHQNQLEGQLKLNVESGDITNIVITNNAPLSPAVSIELTTFLMGFEFQRQSDKMVYRHISLSFSGTVGYVKSINEHTIERFSDYLYLGTIKAEK